MSITRSLGEVFVFVLPLLSHRQLILLIQMRFNARGFAFECCRNYYTSKESGIWNLRSCTPKFWVCLAKMEVTVRASLQTKQESWKLFEVFSSFMFTVMKVSNKKARRVFRRGESLPTSLTIFPGWLSKMPRNRYR